MVEHDCVDIFGKVYFICLIEGEQNINPASSLDDPSPSGDEVKCEKVENTNCDDLPISLREGVPNDHFRIYFTKYVLFWYLFSDSLCNFLNDSLQFLLLWFKVGKVSA